MANVTVTVQLEDDQAAALDGVLVQAYQADGTTFITQATTGAPFAAGTCQITLFGDVAPQTYVLRLSINGYYFAGQPQVSIGVTDPPNPSNTFGPYTATQGPSAVIVTLNTVEADLTTPIAGATVRVYSSPADTFLTEGLTDGSGQLQIPLGGTAAPGTDYVVRAFATGVNFSAPSSLVSVQDPLTPPALTNSFNLVGTPVTLPQAQNTNYCRVTGTLADVSGRPLRGRTIRFIPAQLYADPLTASSAHFTSDPTIVAGSVLVTSVTTSTDSNGLIDVELPRGGCFFAHIHGSEHPINIAERVVIPDLPAASLDALLYPLVASVTYAPVSQALTLAGTSSASITITALDTLGQPMDSSILSSILEFSSSDENIVIVTQSNNLLTVEAVSAGSATITAARVADSFAPRLPAAASLTDPGLVVSVS